MTVNKYMETLTVDTSSGKLINKISIDLEFFNSAFNIVFFDKDNSIALWDYYYHSHEQQGINNTEMDQYSRLTVGEKIKNAFSQARIRVPEDIDEVRLTVNNDLFNTVKLDKYIFNFAARTECKLQEWEPANDRGNFEAVFKRVNPYHLFGAIYAAVKDGMKSPDAKELDEKFEVAAVEKVPEIAKHIEEYRVHSM
ncbi:MAG TPA: hypothetical protein VIN11_03335 [Roseivirga sp.]